MNLTLNSSPPHHTSDQKKVFSPLPTDLLTWFANHSSLRIVEISRHHMEASRPPPNKRPPSTPYLADSTLNHILSLSSSNLQHHFPNNATLNSLILLTHKPPTSLPHAVFCLWERWIFFNFASFSSSSPTSSTLLFGF